MTMPAKAAELLRLHQLDTATIGALVDGIGQRKVSVIGRPGSPAQQDLAELGVARISFGPWIQRIALGAVADAGTDLLAGAPLPQGAWAVT
jgi:2-methylisocitrate lyase-like PEP mutase family enzyme